MALPTSGFLTAQVSYQFNAPTGGGFTLTGFDVNNPGLDMLLGYVETAMQALKDAYETGESELADVAKSYTAYRTDAEIFPTH